MQAINPVDLKRDLLAVDYAFYSILAEETGRPLARRRPVECQPSHIELAKSLFDDAKRPSMVDVIALLLN
ncbi:hypothetical protein GCM10023116_15410 [Kistimonas scapharcae]|uniref:Uncharacterized protein n=1 Tax=Kistimonas scapharcae TaxID=1036133 RepID=A0ABP8V078_9GAMM